MQPVTLINHLSGGNGGTCKVNKIKLCPVLPHSLLSPSITHQVLRSPSKISTFFQLHYYRQNFHHVLRRIHRNMGMPRQRNDQPARNPQPAKCQQHASTAQQKPVLFQQPKRPKPPPSSRQHKFAIVDQLGQNPHPPASQQLTTTDQ